MERWASSVTMMSDETLSDSDNLPLDIDTQRLIPLRKVYWPA